MTWLQLAHKTAIVTGAGSGIGAAVVKGLASEHCRVVLADTNTQAMEKIASSLVGNTTQGSTSGTTSSPSTSHLCVECNVTDPEQVQNLIQQADHFASNTSLSEATSSSEKTATLLVNCAGITRDNWIGKMSLEEWNHVIDVNLTATFLTCRAFLDKTRMEKQALLMTAQHVNSDNIAHQHSIVNVGSIVSELGNLGQANYSASKGGVLGLTRSLAKEVAGRNVRVNAVVPGFIDTPMAQAVPDPVKAQIVSRIPLGRFGQPDEVADLVNFLLSPRSSYITGESIAVSGMISL